MDGALLPGRTCLIRGTPRKRGCPRQGKAPEHWEAAVRWAELGDQLSQFAWGLGSSLDMGSSALKPGKPLANQDELVTWGEVTGQSCWRREGCP